MIIQAHSTGDASLPNMSAIHSKASSHLFIWIGSCIRQIQANYSKLPLRRHQSNTPHRDYGAYSCCTFPLGCMTIKSPNPPLNGKSVDFWWSGEEIFGEHLRQVAAYACTESGKAWLSWPRTHGFVASKRRNDWSPPVHSCLLCTPFPSFWWWEC